MWNIAAAALPFLQLLALYAAAKIEPSVQGNITQAGVTAYFPGQPGYANASAPFNKRFDPHPFAVVYPSNAQEVSEVVKIGSLLNTPVVARSGGHSYIANGLGGNETVLVIDLSNLTQITVDSSSDTATIQPGNRLGDVAVALNNQGRAIPHGSCAYVGFGGHASFGGFGFASRMWGLTLDTIQSVEVVLANGTITNASSTEQPDLFWALRGSAPSFGIITSFTVKTFAAPSSGLIFSYGWTFSSTEAAVALLHLQTQFLTQNLSSLFSSELVLTAGSTVGEVNLAFNGGWYGDPDQLNTTTQPFIEGLPATRSQSVGGGTWIQSVENLAGGSLDTSQPDGTDTFYAKSLILTQESGGFTNESATAFMNYLANEGITANFSWFLEVEVYGGANSAISAVGQDDTAFAWRDALFNIQFYSSSPGSEPPYPELGYALLDGMVNSIVNNSPAGTTFGAYTNYVEDMLLNWQTRYYSSHYSRLQSIKQIVDPRNTFRFLTSIQELY